MNGNAIDTNIDSVMVAMLGAYKFEVGISSDNIHKNAKPWQDGYKKYAGYPLRKIGTGGDKSITDIAIELDAKYKWLRHPFLQEDSADIKKVVDKIIYDMELRQSEDSPAKTERKILAALEACMRDPILRGDYGSNTYTTAEMKGFNKLMMDTGQFIKAITARFINV